MRGTTEPGGRRAFILRHPVRSLLAVTAVLSLTLYLLPSLDLGLTRLFYVPGEGFPASSVPFLRELRRLGMMVFAGVMAVALLSLTIPFLARGATALLPPRAALFLVTAAVFGPGLLVNGLLKGWWGRARPVDVADFGGEAPFTGPWVIGDGCTANCSFVSGEASSSIFLVALAMVAPAAWKPWVAGGAVLFSAVMSLNRIAFGGHFLSDVLLSWCLTLLVLLAAHRAVYHPRNPLGDAEIADALGHAGAWLGGRLSRCSAAARSFLRRFR